MLMNGRFPVEFNAERLIMRKAFFFLMLVIVSPGVFSQQFSQWRGPYRNGIYPESGLLKQWPEDGPALLWKAEGIGKGYSSAVSNGKTVFITGQKEKSDYVTAFDLTGKILWQTEFGPAWSGSFPESRCTPTVEGDRVYVISGLGTIACLDAKDGKILWSIDGIAKFEGEYGTWGVCESPLISGDKLFYSPGGKKTTMVALNKNTGETIWMSESLNDKSAYVSPMMFSMGNKNIVVNVLNDNLIGVDAENGKILWKFDYGALSPEAGLKIWPGAPHTNTVTPLYHDGMLYITGGYNHVGAMFRLAEDASSIDLIWSDTTLDCHHGGVVLIDGNIYGANWFDNARGNWCSIDWKTGKMNYEQTWFTKGSLIYADGLLYCYEEKNGNVAIVKPDPAKFEVISTFRVTEGKGPYWAHPSIKDSILYLRHGDVLMAYDIKQK
jgi:outer membrane protein assembly factor BamB